MTRKIGSTKGAKKKCDQVFSLIIRSHGVCENCGDRGPLETAHVFSRRYSSTRTDLDNAFCLCTGCHMTFTDRPVDFARFCERKLGHDRLVELGYKARKVSRMNWTAELERLREIAKSQGIL